MTRRLGGRGARGQALHPSRAGVRLPLGCHCDSRRLALRLLHRLQSVFSTPRYRCSSHSLNGFSVLCFLFLSDSLMARLTLFSPDWVLGFLPCCPLCLSSGSSDSVPRPRRRGSEALRGGSVWTCATGRGAWGKKNCCVRWWCFGSVLLEFIRALRGCCVDRFVRECAWSVGSLL